jgi:hypothetical protein
MKLSLIRPIDVESPMWTTDVHDVSVARTVVVDGGAVVVVDDGGAVVGSGVVAGAGSSMTFGLEAPVSVSCAGADDVLALSTNAPTTASATTTTAGIRVRRGTLIDRRRDATWRSTTHR